MTTIVHMAVLVLIAALLFPIPAVAGTGDTHWMSEGKYGIFLHHQYRILLGYSIKTKPQFPDPSQMTAEGWNRFVDGFDVRGFARQMAEAKVAWVLFCLDDHYFAWPCAPNQAFCDYTGYAPGEKCSRRDLILELADALNARGVKLICYFASLNGYMKEPKVLAGLRDGDAGRGRMNEKTPPWAEGRRRRLAILKEYADRYKDKIAGWWFDGMQLNTYAAPPDDWWTIESIVHAANPQAIIAFSYGANEQACVCRGVDDYTGGDTWSKQDLQRLTPQRLPPQEGILWHGKIYCGNIYHGQGDDNQFSDQELIDWINTCNRQGGVCTLDWPFDPQTGLLKDFGLAQLKRIACAVKGDEALQTGATVPLGRGTVTIRRIDALPYVQSEFTKRFRFDSFSNPKLKELRERYQLDAVVAPGRDEFERQVLLLDWVHHRFTKFGRPSSDARGALEILQAIDEGHSFFCSHYAHVFVSAAASLGWINRELALRRHQDSPQGGSTEHSPTEIWSNQYRKWVMMDPTAHLYIEKNGTPLNAYEIRQEWFYREGRDLVFVVGKERKEYRKSDLPIFLGRFAGFGDLTVPVDELDKYGFIGYIPNTDLMDAGLDYGQMFIVKDKLCEGTRWHQRTVPANPAVDPYFPINQAAVRLVPEQDHLRVTLQTLTPNFRAYEARMDGGAWRSCGEGLPWNLHPGPNRLEVRTVNQFGVAGPISTVESLLTTGATSGGPDQYPFFPFCIDWHDAKKRSFEQQAQMLKELGYPGVGHIWLDKVEERIRTLDAAGLKLFQITMAVEVAPGKAPYDAKRFQDVCAAIQGRSVQSCLLLNGMKPSDPTVDPHAVDILRAMSDQARASGAQLLLYPHQASWVERLEDAIRVADKVDRPNVGVMFNLCHWLRVDSGRDYRPLLKRALPRLWAVSINGADTFDEKPGWERYIQPLDQGSFDVGQLLRALKELGYHGPIGLQCYGIGGDAREHLARSLTAWQKLRESLND